MDDLRAAFDMVDAIRAIVRCESATALKALRKVIDDRIGELEALTLNLMLKDEQNIQKPEQKLSIIEQTIQKPEKIPPVIEQTIETEQKGKKHRPYQLFSSDQILDHRGTLSIYKPVVDIILEKTSDTFSPFDTARIILSFFLTKGRVITEKSAIKYSYIYLNYMVSNEMIVIDQKGSYKKLKKDEFEGIKNGIYQVVDDQKNKKILERRSFEDNIRDSDAVGVDDL